eukprot:scaffold7349_cov383-Pinguiococcus_pyrenoidosus.AAC.10
MPPNLDELAKPAERRVPDQLVAGAALLHENVHHGPKVLVLCRVRSGLDGVEKGHQRVVGVVADVAVAVSEHLDQALEELGEPVQQVDVRHTVQHGDPAHEQLADKGVALADVLVQQGHEIVHIKGR